LGRRPLAPGSLAQCTSSPLCPGHLGVLAQTIALERRPKHCSKSSLFAKPAPWTPFLAPWASPMRPMPRSPPWSATPWLESLTPSTEDKAPWALSLLFSHTGIACLNTLGATQFSLFPNGVTH
ncbi:unnamed protein product, partial [Ilex paraguariensis]